MKKKLKINPDDRIRELSATVLELHLDLRRTRSVVAVYEYENRLLRSVIEAYERGTTLP